jgi:hypothetical protein
MGDIGPVRRRVDLEPVDVPVEVPVVEPTPVPAKVPVPG